MRHGCEVGSSSHDQAADANQPGTMELRTKVAHKGYYQQVACEEEIIKITEWMNELLA